MRVLEELGAAGAIQAVHHDLVVHTPGREIHWPVPEPFCTFDYRTCCRAAFEGARIVGTLRSWAGRLTVPGCREIRVSSVTGVTVAPTHRRQGILGRMAGSEHGSAKTVAQLTDIAGPRVHIRPIEGLPLLHVEEPTLSGPGWLAKNLLDRIAAALGLSSRSVDTYCSRLMAKLELDDLASLVKFAVRRGVTSLG